MTHLTPLLKEIELEVEIDDIHRIFYDDDDVTILRNCYDEKRGSYVDIVGFDAHIKLTAKERIALSIEIDGLKSEFTENPLLILKELFDRYHVDPSFPFSFCSGGMGYMGYEMYNLLRGRTDSGYPAGVLVPDLYFNFYRIFLIIDKKENKKFLLSVDFADDLDKREENQHKRLESFEKKLNYGMIFYKDEKKQSRDICPLLSEDKTLAEIDVIKNALTTGLAAQVHYAVPFETNYPYHGGELFSRINADSDEHYCCYIQNEEFISYCITSEQKEGDTLVFGTSPGKNPVLAFINRFPSVNKVGVPMEEAAGLIAEKESFCRNTYAGMTGYLSFGGDINLQSTAEAWVLKNEKIRFFEGINITKDSDSKDILKKILAKGNKTGERLFK